MNFILLMMMNAGAGDDDVGWMHSSVCQMSYKMKWNKRFQIKIIDINCKIVWPPPP